jgi:hypothetical protein
LTEIRALTLFVITLLTSLSAYGANTAILENIDTLDTKKGPQIVVTFNHSVRYISHSPHTANDIFEIRMASQPLSGNTEESLLGTQTMQWSPSAAVPLFDITYESTVPGNSRLTVRFQSPVQIEVLTGKDVRTLVIQLPPSKVAARQPARQLPSEVQFPPSVDAGVQPGAIPDSQVFGGYSQFYSGDPKIQALMETARQAVATKDFTTAIRLYEKVLRDGGPEVKPIALEFLGVVRDKNGQKAQAKLVYKRYLAEYPDGEAAERVQQRLTGLITATKRPPQKLRGAKVQPGEKPDWQVFGGISQFYRRDNQTTNLDEDDELTSVSRSSLTSDLDLSARLRTDAYSVRTRFSGGYEKDFLSDGPGSNGQVSTLYAKFSDRKRNLHLQAGRQPGNKGGVLGRFDGALFSVGLPKEVTLNFVGGYPVDSSRDSLDTDRYFFGANVDLKPFGKEWDLNAFIIHQDVEGITDRQAVGGELRYFAPGRSFFTLADYDILYDELNTFLFLGHWTFPDSTTVNLSVDYRKSPLLTTSNALQGQLSDSMDSLLSIFSESEIRELARDRTATSRMITLGASRPLGKDLQINGDVTISDLSSTKTSGGVIGTPSSGDDYSLNLQLVRSNWLKAGDIHTLGFRYADTNAANTDISNTSTINFNSRYPVTSKLNLNPRFRIDYRENASDDSTQTIYRPFLRVNYRMKRSLLFESDIGGEWSNRDLTDDTDKTRSWFANIGYRQDF